MKKIGTLIGMEISRYVVKRKMLILLFVFLICAYVVHIRIGDYKDLVERSVKFQTNESYIEKSYRMYDQLALYGVRALYIPSASAIFFSSPSTYSEITARINSISLLEIYENKKKTRSGDSGFPIQLSFYMVVLIFGIIISLYEGFLVPREEEYRSMVTSLTNRHSGPMIVPVVIIRSVLLAVFFLAISGSMLGLVLLEGINLSKADITSITLYAASACVLFLSCLFLGSLIGKMRRKSVGVLVILILWIGLLIVLPSIINSLNDELAVEVTSTYKVDLEIRKNIRDFESDVVKKYGKFDRKKIELFRMIVQGYLEKEYKENEAMESQIREQMAENASTYNMISIFNPVSFYFQTASAAGSCSDENVIEFYKYAQTMKRKLLEFIVERTYYNDPKIMVPFVKGEENLFYAKSHLPPNFGWGLLFNLFLVLVLAVITHFVYSNGPKHVKNNTIPRINPNTELSNLRCDRFGAVYVTNNRIRDFLFKLFCGKMPETVRPTDWSIKIDNVDIFSKELQGDFFYICRPGDIPGDIKVKTFLSFFASQGNLSASERSAVMDSSVIKPLLNKSFDQLKESERFEVMLSLTGLVKRKVYLVDDIIGELDSRYALRLFDRMKIISENGSYVLYLTSKIEAPPKMESFSDDVDFATGKPWYYVMTSRWLASKYND